MGNYTSNSKKLTNPDLNKEQQNTTAEQILYNQKNDETINNINKVMPKEQTTSDVVETLNITEFKESNEQIGGSKKELPLIRGSNMRSNLSETSENIISKFENKTGRKRYTKYDLFKILKNLDIDTENELQGGDIEDDVKTESSLNDDESMEHIKKIILKELDTLKNNKSQQLGGTGCGCSGSNDKKTSHKLSSKLNLNNIIIDDKESKQLGGTVIIDGSSSSSDSSVSGSSSSSSSSELGKSNPKSNSKSKSKSKSKSVKKQESSESSIFVIETSESGKEKKSESESESESDSDKDKDKNKNKNKDKDEQEQTSNGKSDEGLSIFPFNSSDVKSSLSIKNYRMLRRKI